MKRHEKHAVEKLKSGNFNFFLKIGLILGLYESLDKHGHNTHVQCVHCYLTYS